MRPAQQLAQNYSTWGSVSNLRRAGVAEGVLMKIEGWRTRSVFERYAIVSQADIADAFGRLELRDGYSFEHSQPDEENPTEDAKA